MSAKHLRAPFSAAKGQFEDVSSRISADINPGQFQTQS